MATYVRHDDPRLDDLFVGKSVTKVADDRLLLSDGTELTLVGNEGCGGCTSGHYHLTDLNDCDNIITAVDVAVEGDEDDGWQSELVYRLFVFAENRKINLATFEGDDGNGYYGTGFHITVSTPSA